MADQQETQTYDSEEAAEYRALRQQIAKDVLRNKVAGARKA